jgi:quercetin dioxygenase-like cupin family protein
MIQWLLAIGLGCAAYAAAQDPVPVSSDYKAEIENNWVRVLRVKRRPHAKAPMHQHPASVLVFLTDYHQKVTSADGKVQEIARKAGDVSYIEAVKHSEENLSDQPLEVVVIELKPRPADFKPAPIALDPVKLDPEHHLVPLENDRVRVLRTILEPHLKSPMHEHPHYVVVYLTELHTTMKLGDGRVVDNPRRPSEIAWRDALKHQTENIGDRTAIEIQVELK